MVPPLQVPSAFIRTFRATLTATGLEPSLQAYALTLPDYSVLSQVTYLLPYFLLTSTDSC